MGGPGLNLGMQDAVNLGWKLAAAVTGRAPDGLLDTYESERYPVGERVMMHSQAQLALAAPGPEVEALRSLFAELVPQPDVTKHMAGLLAGSDVRYDVGDGHRLSGQMVPDLDLDDGRRVVELLHDGRPVLIDATVARRQPLHRPGRIGWTSSPRAYPTAPQRCSSGPMAMSPGPQTNWSQTTPKTCAWRWPAGSVRGSSTQFQGGRDDRLGPLRRRGQVGRRDDLTVDEVQHQRRLWVGSRGGVGVRGVVIDPKLGQRRQQLDEVLPAVPPATPDHGLRNVVSALAHPMGHPRNVLVGLASPTYQMRTSTPCEAASASSRVIVEPPNVVSKAKSSRS